MEKNQPPKKPRFENDVERTQFLLRLVEKKIAVEVERNRLLVIKNCISSKLRRVNITAVLQRHMLEKNAGEEAKQAWRGVIDEVAAIMRSYNHGNTPEDMFEEIIAVVRPHLLAKDADAIMRATEEITAAFECHCAQSSSEKIDELTAAGVLAVTRAEKDEIESRLKSM